MVIKKIYSSVFLQEWSETIAKHAQDWANKCGGPDHGNYKEFGEGQNFGESNHPKSILKTQVNYQNRFDMRA